MKPLNLDVSGCDPISSNCVIWQGPDLPCIALCKGDTVTVVIYKLATELCTLMDTFKIENYDLSCLELSECAPQNFEALIQLLINRICALENITPPTPTPGSTGCPDCEVTICTSFQYTNPLGDLVTSMQLKDYVVAIGNRLCQLIGQLTTMQSSIVNLNGRVTVLENMPAPVFTMPKLIPTCVITPAVLTNMDLVLAALEQQFCELRTYTGMPQDILVAVNSQCPNLNTAPLMHGNGTMSSLPGWNQTIANWAQSFSNLWLTVCDLRNAVGFIQNNCCDTGCSSIELDITGELLSATSLRLIFSGTVPSNYIDAPIGSTISITDSVGGGPQIINGVMIKGGYYDLSVPYMLTLTNPPNGANNLTVVVTSRFYDPSTESVCETMTQLLVLGTNTCPVMALTPNYTGINYTFSWIGVAPLTIGVELWNAGETLMLQSYNLLVNSTPSNPAGSFINLVENTVYNIRLIIMGEPCAFMPFTTLAHACVAPTLNAPTISYDNPMGTTTGLTIAAWQAEYNAYHP